MVYIHVSGRGCRTSVHSDTPFRCSMCRPWKSRFDPNILDRVTQCALSKIDRGVIYQYHEPIYERDPITKKEVIVDYKFIEKYRDKV